MRRVVMPIIALLTAACPPVNEPAPSFAQDIQPLFNGSCTISGCHGGPESATGLDLDEDMAYDMLVGVASSQVAIPRVDPGDAENSYLVHKVAGSHEDVGGSGDLMPPVVGASSEDVQMLIDWIAAGALYY